MLTARTYAGDAIVPGSEPAQRLCRLRPSVAARLVNGTQRVPEDPIRNAAALSSSDYVRMAVVDADVHARVDDLLFRLREVREGARLLRGQRVSGDHLKGQIITTEKEPQDMGNRATDIGVT